jgi:glycosyltransferase involved in cell wall biosynthesis
MLLSVLPHVDEIVLGVDGRSDAETREVAEAYADTIIVFDAAMIGLSDEDWAADKIHFSNARNLGRARLRSDWSLVIDSDEYLQKAADFRALAAKAGPVGSYGIDVRLPGFKMKEDLQRFARSKYRWSEAIHNQLLHTDPFTRCEALIVSDPALRRIEEISRRHAQRDLCIEDLAEEASKGNITALFHLTKHRSAKGDITAAAKMAEDYRLRIEPHSILFNERIWIALGVAFRYYHEDNFDEAERWAVRALLDGPNITAFCLLGDIAEDQGDLPRALGWYEAACACTQEEKMAWPGFSDLRFGRLSGIRMAIKDPLTAPIAEITEEPLEAVAGAVLPS